MTTPQKSDILIIGGGVLGVSLAYHLSKYNLSIILLEKERSICTHASAKNAGMIRQLYRESTLTYWAEESIRTWPEELKKRCFKETGSIVVGRTPPNHSEHLFIGKNFISGEESIPYVYCPTDGLLESEDYVQGLKQMALSSGKLRISTDSKVIRLSKIDSNNWQVETEKAERFDTALLVNATGAWINSILTDFPELQINAEPFVRHLFLSQGWDQTFGINGLPKHGFYWDELGHWYKRNWANDSQLVSACDVLPADPDGYVPKTEISYLLADKILSALPDNGEKIKLGQSWHCFRTYTEDQLPVIGFDTEYPNFYWLGAFGGFGMSTSFAATQDAAQEIQTGQKLVGKKFSAERCKKTSGAMLENS